MRLALAQMKCVPGDAARNVRTMCERIRAAADAGCDAVVFPEMSDTGYDMPSIVRASSSWVGGIFQELSGIAAERNVTVVAGLSERVGDDIYNSTAVIGGDGKLLAKYRKIHLFSAEPVCEPKFIRPGNELALCTVAGFRVGLMTCYDIRFPELARALALSGAELLIVPAAFPLARIDHWSILTAGRAIENQVYLAAVNRVGTDCGLAFGGTSRILDPNGTVLASSNETDEALIVGEVSRDRLDEVRERMKVFRDRREDCYSLRG